ncbi:extensin-like [Limulus polyphemus]|uniref:Extensin-like n=1 Tax=Limulus polyphemus TaxID=6850 RepID=A0ABM1BUU4_LIMPO|nr:extensin-like [Limulus polyphemus]
MRLPDGSVKGSYGYLDQNNQPRIVRYLAGKEGFVAEGDVGPVDSPPPAPKPIPHHLVANKPRQYLPPQQRVASQPPRYLPPQQRVASQPPRYLPPQQRVASQPPRYVPPQQRVASQPPRYLPPQQSVASQPPRHAPQQQVVRPVLQRDFVPEPQFHLESPEDLGPPFIDTSLLSYNIGTKQRT